MFFMIARCKIRRNQNFLKKGDAFLNIYLIYFYFLILMSCEQSLLEKSPSKKPRNLSKDSVSPLADVEAKFSFLVFGDSGTGEKNQMSVAKGMRRACKDKKCHYGIMLGDNFYEIGVESTEDQQFKEKNMP